MLSGFIWLTKGSCEFGNELLNYAKAQNLLAK
jgi:hypothetical protein